MCFKKLLKLKCLPMAYFALVDICVYNKSYIIFAYSCLVIEYKYSSEVIPVLG